MAGEDGLAYRAFKDAVIARKHLEPAIEIAEAGRVPRKIGCLGGDIERKPKAPKVLLTSMCSGDDPSFHARLRNTITRPSANIGSHRGFSLISEMWVGERFSMTMALARCMRVRAPPAHQFQ
jgi:hypothetical protein